MILTKIKIKEHAKLKSLTVHLLVLSLIILVTFHTIFASFYFAPFQYFHDINWNTLNLEMAVWSGDLPSPLMAIFTMGRSENYLIFEKPMTILIFLCMGMTNDLANLLLLCKAPGKKKKKKKISERCRKHSSSEQGSRNCEIWIGSADDNDVINQPISKVKIYHLSQKLLTTGKVL